jgi:hypothetical protein
VVKSIEMPQAKAAKNQHNIASDRPGSEP